MARCCLRGPVRDRRVSLEPAPPSPGRPAAEPAGDQVGLAGVGVELDTPLLEEDPDEVPPWVEPALTEVEPGDLLVGQAPLAERLEGALLSLREARIEVAQALG
jgi:hypothetical protein